YFSIYPNPVKSGNEFIVEMPDNLENRMNIIWEIVSAEGKVLDSGAAANMNSIKIKAPSTAGVYFIVFNDGQELVNQRIVVE
ncbi:T9SS type A sorting domain-containing protein, partial [Salibacteraceae bacterium]|nr:T9SS type A sorting domain-containing protein [Salibacteraceae bacterium]